MGGIGYQASGVQSLNTQTRVRVWSLEHGRAEVPVRTQALGRPEVRALAVVARQAAGLCDGVL